MVNPTTHANNNNNTSAISSNLSNCINNNNTHHHHQPNHSWSFNAGASAAAVAAPSSSSTINQPQHPLYNRFHHHQKLSDLSNNNGNSNSNSNYISNSNNTSSCSTTSSSAKDVVVAGGGGSGSSGGHHHHHYHRHHHHHYNSGSAASERPNGSGGAGRSAANGDQPTSSGKLYHSQTLTPSTRKRGTATGATGTGTGSLTTTAKGSPYCTSACSNQLMHLSLDESNMTATASDGGGGAGGGSIRKNRTPTLKAIGMSQSLHQPHSSTQSLAKVSMASGSSHSNSNGANVEDSSTNGGVPATKPSYSPMQVLMMFGNKLSPYEYREILDYKRIYFIGNAATAATGEGASSSGTGSGGGGNNAPESKTEKSRDKESVGAVATAATGTGAGDTNTATADKRKSQATAAAAVVENFTPASHDHVAYRYEVLKLIGKGSFGVVYKAYDHKYGRYVALKMVRNERRFHRQAQEEIKILEYLRRMDHRNEFNVIHMYDHFIFRQQMFITFELLYINLFELIRKNKFCGFSIQVVRKFAHSLLICLNALHNQKIIHCDLKPENILLKQQGRSGIKVSLSG